MITSPFRASGDTPTCSTGTARLAAGCMGRLCRKRMNVHASTNAATRIRIRGRGAITCYRRATWADWSEGGERKGCRDMKPLLPWEGQVLPSSLTAQREREEKAKEGKAELIYGRRLNNGSSARGIMRFGKLRVRSSLRSLTTSNVRY